MKWMDSVKNAIGTGLEELRRAVEDGCGGHQSFMEPPGVRAHSRIQNTHIPKPSELYTLSG